MKLKLNLTFCISLFIGAAAIHETWGQGALTPPAPPGPTMRTLQQVEPRVPISSSPFVISNSGSYYLTTNLNVGSSNAITILANEVTLDLNGFSIYSTAASANGAGIMLGSSRTNITIRNGFIRGSVTQSGGVFSGGGFDSGIFIVIDATITNTFGLPFNVRVSNLTISGCLTYGIGLGGASFVDSCSVITAGTSGISAGTIRNCSATECGTVGISGQMVIDCQAACVGDGRAISAVSLAQNCYGTSESGVGVFVSESAENCHGICNGDDNGLYAEDAVNCTGKSATGTGLRATGSASNCRGQGGSVGLEADDNGLNCTGRANTNGVGLLCYGNASNCYGYVPAGNSGNGLSASQANNCYGQHDGNGIGLQATIAIGCHGRCYGNNFGISATIVNSCYAYRAVGTPAVSFGYKYNMP